MSRQMTYGTNRFNSRIRPPMSGLIRLTRPPVSTRLSLGLREEQLAHFFIFLRFRCLRRIRFLAHLSLIRDDYLIINNKAKLIL